MKKILRKIPCFIFSAALIVGLNIAVFSQRTLPPVAPPAPPETKTGKPKVGPVSPPSGTPVMPPARTMPPIYPWGGEDHEKSLKVDARVNISMCVITGNVKINGWDRNEVRIFVNEGSNININVRAKDRKSEQPILVDVTALNSTDAKHKKMPMLASECIWGSEIEIDAPHDAALTIKGDETSINIDSIRKAWVKNAGGNITLRNIAERVDALTYEGNVTVNDSAGVINLESSSGNILAFNVSPAEIGDSFKAKTASGKIFLQQIEQRQIEVNSISGAVMYTGKLVSGGLYSFSTSNGAITLAIPADSSSKLNASYGYGQFNCDFQLKDVRKDMTSFKNISGVIGSGDAMLKLSTHDGSIKIKKQ